MCHKDENSILSLQIDFNVSLKDFKYKTSEQHFQNVHFFWQWTIPLPVLMHRSAELQRKVYI